MADDTAIATRRSPSPRKNIVGPKENNEENLSERSYLDEEQPRSQGLSTDDDNAESILESLQSDSRAATDVVNLCMNKVCLYDNKYSITVKC